MSRMRSTIFTLISISLYGLIHAGPTCMRCNEVAEVAECLTNTVTCGDNEECYLEKVTKEDLSIRYNAGCRSKQVCTLMAALSAGRKRDLVNCADCCSDAPDKNGPCNAKLCGLTPQEAQATCVACDGVHSDVLSCTTAATCPPNEVCYTGIRIVGTAIRYVFGCYAERVCRAMLENDGKNSSIHHLTGRVIHGDHGTKICDACCKGDKCNSGDCFEIKKKMASMFGTSQTPAAATTPVITTSATVPVTTPVISTPQSAPASAASSNALPSIALSTPATPTTT